MQYRKKQPNVEIVVLPGEVVVDKGMDRLKAAKGDMLVFEDGQFVDIYTPEQFAKEYEAVTEKNDPAVFRFVWPRGDDTGGDHSWKSKDGEPDWVYRWRPYDPVPTCAGTFSVDGFPDCWLA